VVRGCGGGGGVDVVEGRMLTLRLCIIYI